MKESWDKIYNAFNKSADTVNEELGDSIYELIPEFPDEVDQLIDWTIRTAIQDELNEL